MKTERPPKRGARRLVGCVFDLVPTTALHKLLANIAARRARKLSPADGLRFLFNLDASLYRTQGQVAVAYGDGTHPKHRHMRYHEFFVSRIRKGERVLDIGCGIGAVAYDVADRGGAEVVGIDLDANNIAQAHARYGHPRVHYVVGDVLRELPGETFDVVILSNVLEHLPDRAQFLHRVQTAVTPTRLLIRVPLFERDWRVPLKKELGVDWRLDDTHETEYTLESFAAEMADANLRITHQTISWGEIWAEVHPNAA